MTKDGAFWAPKSTKVLHAERVRPDVVSYNAVMGACGEASRWQVVLSLSNLPLVNLISFNTAIKAFDRWEGREKLRDGRYATPFREHVLT